MPQTPPYNKLLRKHVTFSPVWVAGLNLYLTTQTEPFNLEAPNLHHTN